MISETIEVLGVKGESLMISTLAVLFEGSEVEIRMKKDVPEVHVMILEGGEA